MHQHLAMVDAAYIRSLIEAPQLAPPLITREVLPEIYFLLVLRSMATDAQSRPFLQLQASCLYGSLCGSFFNF
jgi:hypothetical protein